ncbi:Lrp/AsnC family transcriptional regulator [Fibrobacter succinogenes]|uniref:Lrp/AsnC family transcriptional regulator n=1 Tax=Fibrobacter succinogenes TaxID=833 RepID=UPI00156A2FF0|nr:Lrp/AsnC family transcriptional regulator [Fibrobacter succinogenes]
MNSFEQQILDVIQDAFPLAERPYAVLAEKIGSDETTVFDAVEKMRASGVIRRIGGVYDSKKLGFISRLCAGKVLTSSLDFSAEPHAQTAMENFATVVMSEPSITHNYIRSHEYNVWFTVIAENESAIQAVVDRVCAKTDLHDVHVMSATRKFKINTVMKGASVPVDSRQLAVGRNSDERGTERHSDNLVILEAKRRGTIISRVDAWLEESSEFRKTAVDLSESDKIRIRTACEDIPHSLTPFKDWGVSCEELREDIDAKRMRRFGAILRHQDAGFAFNAMVCFRIVDSRKSEVGRGSNVILSGEATKDPVKSCDLIAQAGSLLASNPHISHCYERPSFEGFPYNVYAMMHANSAELLDQIIADCVNALSALQQSSVEFVVLNSVRELKKTSFKFFA